METFFSIFNCFLFVKLIVFYHFGDILIHFYFLEFPALVFRVLWKPVILLLLGLNRLIATKRITNSFQYVYMCVFLCLWLYVCVYVYVYMYIYVSMYMYIYICVYTYKLSKS